MAHTVVVTSQIWVVEQPRLSRRKVMSLKGNNRHKPIDLLGWSIGPPLRLLLPVLLLCCSTATRAQPGEQALLDAALNGDLRPVLQPLTTNLHDSSLLQQELNQRLASRFVQRTEDQSPASGNGFIDAVVSSYRAYWVEVLTQPDSAAPAAQQLQHQLTLLLEQAPLPTGARSGSGPGTQTTARSDQLSAAPRGTASPATTSPGVIEPDLLTHVLAEIARQGFYAQVLHSPPWHDLMIWRREQRQTHEVNLTDGQQTVDVILMDDFVSLGWPHFASLGLHSVSGWADGNQLYGLSWAYEPDSEAFRVSFLQHEARHAADYQRFPGLDETELEYRAKLTELAFAGNSVSSLLGRFAEGADGLGQSAHARANQRVVEDIYREIFHGDLPQYLNPWPSVRPQQVNPAARVLLQRHTNALLQRRGVLPVGGVR